MRDHDGELSFTPRLPERADPARVPALFRGRRLLVDVEPEQATYTLTDGAPLEIVHHGESATVQHGRPLRRPIPPPPAREAPTQPPGRAPAPRGAPR